MAGSRLIALVLLAAAGCGTRTPAPTPAPVDTGAPVASDKQPAQRAASETSSKVKPPPASDSPADVALTARRELAARYLNSDGTGGWRVNEQAATDLEKLDRGEVAQFVSLLSDRQVEVRRGAAYFLLGHFNPSEPALTAAFAGLLADSDPTVRGLGLSAVKQMHEADQVAAAPQLAAMLDPNREDKADNRVSVARTLAGLKSQAAGVAGQIAAAAQSDPDPQVRSACLVALAGVAPPEQAVPALAQGLADKEASVRLVAAARLRQLGTAAAPVAQQLAAALADSDPRVANAAGQALVNIGKDAVGAIAEQLSSKNVEARKLALACLAKIGSDAAAAAPAVQKLLQDADPQVQQLAAAALARIKSP